MKILIYLAVWKRPEVTEICFMGINRLKRYGILQIDAFAVISEESMIPLCEKYGVTYCYHDNLPLGKKLNYGLSESLKLDWDYVICIGSDDILKNELLDLYKPYFGVKPLLGIQHFVYLSSKTMGCRIVKSNIHGLGRAVSRSVVEQFPNMWPSKQNRGMDKYSHFLLATNGIFDTRVSGSGPLAIDIKSQVNIWPYTSIGVKYNFEDAVTGLSVEEIEAIKSLQYVAA